MFRACAIVGRAASLRPPQVFPCLRSFHATLLCHPAQNPPTTSVETLSTVSEAPEKRKRRPGPVKCLTNDGAKSREADGGTKPKTPEQNPPSTSVETPSTVPDAPKKRKRKSTPVKSLADSSSKPRKAESGITKRSKQAAAEALGSPSEFLHERDAIINYLEQRRKGVARVQHRRVDIVSEKLCDDIVERLKPSLGDHVGCDIIDINPGAGLWSKKLHEFLKPRTHLLVEPEESVYRPLLQPLLDAECSTYRYIPKSGVIWAHLEEILTKEYLPSQGTVANHENGAKTLNNTLLFTANIGYFPKKPYRGFASLALLLLYQFLGAARAHSLFHQYGAVRMLIWVLDSEKQSVLPRTISLRRKSAIEAEVTCSQIAEVASSTSLEYHLERDVYLDVRSTAAALSRMDRAGIETPKGRKSAAALEISNDSNAGEHERKITRNYIHELEQLEADFAARKFTEWSEKSGSKKRTRTAEWVRMRQLRYQRVAETKKGAVFVDLVNEFEALMDLQREVYNATGDTASLEEHLQKQSLRWHEKLADLGPQGREKAEHLIENHRAFYLTPPLLQWDRREYEPLKVHSTEFHPTEELCLLDFHPQPLWPLLQDKYPANYDVFEYIVSSLLIVPTQTIRKGFNALWPGALEWLLAECPSLTDPNRGGNMDIDLFSVRSLTLEMYKEILEAWMRWPFRPSRYQLMVRVGSNMFDPDPEVLDRR